MPIPTSAPSLSKGISIPTTMTDQPPLPPPQTFDFLPALHPLLQRLLLSEQPQSTEAASSPTPIPTHTPDPHTSSTTINTLPLSAKDLPTESSHLTLKVQKAIQAVKLLEGMELSVKEQEDVIEKLEKEVERGRKMIEKMGKVAKESL